ncbi:TonB-dependent receptor plug domain-containing protein [Phreatobacter sp.]|uniref:TonB-dependent receptor plug domain-containing protein n=1 Tax=Phreatobacter sp. TaxID=1966341 RepID=UPI003F6E6526
MSSRSIRASAASLILCLGAPPALAQGQTTTLPEVVITATRTEEDASRTGTAVTVLRAEQIQRSNPGSVVDVLRGVPGLDITENGGPGGSTAVRLRGANPGQTLVLIDGQRANDPGQASGEFNFAMLAPGLIERIEVLRGPQSALYGSDAIGGVINIITRKGSGPTRVTAEIQGGSFATASGGGTISGSRDGWSYAFSAFGARSEGFSRYGYRIPRITAVRPNLEADGYERIGGSARIGYDTGWGLTFDSALFYTNTRLDYDSAFGTFPDTASRGRQALLNGWTKAAYETADRRFAHSLTVFINDTDRRFIDVTYSAAPFTPANTNQSISDFFGRRIGAEYQGTARLDAFGTVVFGARHERESILTSSQVQLPVLMPLVPGQSASQVTNSVFGLWTLPVGDRLTVSLGGRVDRIVDGPQFATWRSTAAYQIPETGTTLRASAGTGGKAPTLFQRFDPTYGNAALQPETSFGWDAGIDQRIPGNLGSVSVTYFNNRIRNLIDFVFTPAPGGYLNVSRARIHGVEVAAAIHIVPRVLSFHAAYTHLDARNAASGLLLARRPPHSARLSMVWTPDDKWRIEPMLFLVSHRFSGNNQTSRLAPYARLDVRADYKLTRNVTLFARAENLFDVRYEEILNYGTAGRSVYAGLRGTW